MFSKSNVDENLKAPFLEGRENHSFVDLHLVIITIKLVCLTNARKERRRKNNFLQYDKYGYALARDSLSRK